MARRFSRRTLVAVGLALGAVVAGGGVLASAPTAATSAICPKVAHRGIFLDCVKSTANGVYEYRRPDGSR